MINKFDDQYRWLSNFWPCAVLFDGHEYPTVEHAYVAAKTIDQGTRYEIRQLKKPGDAKRYGRKLDVRKDWDSVKLDIMESLLRQKFSRGSDLGMKLDHTGNQSIFEGNTWGDTFWGVCNGAGLNHLGRLIMKIREENRL